MTQQERIAQEQSAIRLKPIVSYPREAKVGERYLFTIDVQLTEDSPWPYQEEEFEISFILETSPFFTHEPVGEHEPGLVLHRYGGTYGAAEYLLTAAKKTVAPGKIKVTLLNGWGLPIAHLELECEVKHDVMADPGHTTTVTRRKKQSSKPIQTVTKTQKQPVSYNPLYADVLLVTATDIEAQTVHTIFLKEGDCTVETHFIGNLAYFDFGFIAGARVCMVRSEMGANGLAGVALTTNEAIQTLAPSAVIMVGIAFGIDQERQQIGNILVSSQLFGYELQRINKTETPMRVTLRGDRPSTPPRILNIFRAAKRGWSGPKVEFGLMFSGDKLIDNIDFRTQLLQMAPDAIGGEMEGTGIYAAAQRHKVDWILVKAICDWADGSTGHNKDVYQQQAAEDATRFVFHVLKQGGFQKDTASAPLSEEDNKVYNPQTPQRHDFHTSWVVAVAWEPRGNRIASAGGDNTVRVWDTDEKRLLLTYHGPPTPLHRTNISTTIYALAWAPEGLRIASAGNGNKVYVWDATTGNDLAIYRGHTGLWPATYAVAWSPDGSRIASACSVAPGKDRTIHVWDIETSQKLFAYDTPFKFSPTFSILAVAWSPDGANLAAIVDLNTICIWHTDDKRPIATYRSTSSYNDLAWSPDSTKIAAATTDHTVEIWDIKTGRTILTYSGHMDRVRAVAWSPDGLMLASASNDTTVHIWNPVTGVPLYKYLGHTDWATSVAWSPDGSRIASASNDKTVQIWQVPSQENLSTNDDVFVFEVENEPDEHTR